MIIAPLQISHYFGTAQTIVQKAKNIFQDLFHPWKPLLTSPHH